MLPGLQCLAANAHDFAQVFGDVTEESGSEASRICPRFRCWMNFLRDCSNLQKQPERRRRFAESPCEIGEGGRL